MADAPKTSGPIVELAGPAMDDVTMDTVLAKMPTTITEDEFKRIVTRQRDDRAAWLKKQEKKGKEE